MNAPFHTPSFGDEVFAVTENDSHINNSYEHQQPQSKRMRVSMDNSFEDYHSANDDSSSSFVVTSNNSAHVLSSTPITTATAAARKQLTPSSDQNEPAKPLSAYALFFRDTVSAIKQQNPTCSFQEISRIVASMWEALDPAHKNVYQKKNEMAKAEYIMQMRNHRQQQQQLDQQQQISATHMSSNTMQAMQTRPAVFTISRPNENELHTYTNHTALVNNHEHVANSAQKQVEQQAQYQSQQQQQQPTAFQQQFELQQQQSYSHAQQPTANNCVEANPPPAQQIQLLTEAGSVQKCIREHCNKRAIINPDWEDEYCSNECVVIHCRNVFNAWIQSNLDTRSQ